MRSDRCEHARSADLPGGFGHGVASRGEVSAGRGAGGGERHPLCRGCGALAGGRIRRISGRRVADAGGAAGRGVAEAVAGAKLPRQLVRVASATCESLAVCIPRESVAGRSLAPLVKARGFGMTQTDVTKPEILLAAGNWRLASGL